MRTYVINPYFGSAYILLGLTPNGAKEILERIKLTRTLAAADKRLTYIAYEAEITEDAPYAFIDGSSLPEDIADRAGREKIFCTWDEGHQLLDKGITWSIKGKGHLWQKTVPDGVCWCSIEHVDKMVDINESCIFPESELIKIADNQHANQ